MGRYRLLVAYLIPLIAAVAVSVVGLHQARQIALADQDVIDTFYSLSRGWEEYKELRQEWRGRILSNALAGVLVNIGESRHGLTDPAENMLYVAGFSTFGWLLLGLWKEVPLRRRAMLAGLTTVLAIGAKGAGDLLTSHPSPILTMTADEPGRGCGWRKTYSCYLLRPIGRSIPCWSTRASSWRCCSCR